MKILMLLELSVDEIKEYMENKGHPEFVPSIVTAINTSSNSIDTYEIVY